MSAERRDAHDWWCVFVAAAWIVLLFSAGPWFALTALGFYFFGGVAGALYERSTP